MHRGSHAFLYVGLYQQLWNLHGRREVQTARIDSPCGDLAWVGSILAHTHPSVYREHNFQPDLGNCVVRCSVRRCRTYKSAAVHRRPRPLLCVVSRPQSLASLVNIKSVSGYNRDVVEAGAFGDLPYLSTVYPLYVAPIPIHAQSAANLPHDHSTSYPLSVG
jgi:hypothetical protein